MGWLFGSALVFFVADWICFSKRRSPWQAPSILRGLRSPVTRGWASALVALVHAVMMLWLGMKAYVWEGFPWLLSSGVALAGCYIGLWIASEKILNRHRAEPALWPILLDAEYPPGSEFRPFANFWGGFAELRRGDLQGFWRNAVPSPAIPANNRAREGTEWGQARHRRLNLWRVLNLALMIGLGLWGVQALRDRYGVLIVLGFVMGVGLALIVNALVHSVREKRMSLLVAITNGGLLVAGLAFTSLAVYLALAMIPAGIGLEIAHAQALPGLLGTLLGLVAYVPLLDWKGPR